MELLKRFGFLAMVAPALFVYACVPEFVPYMRYLHILSMIGALFCGRSFVRIGDLRGWAWENAAVLAHAACLVGYGVIAG